MRVKRKRIEGPTKNNKDKKSQVLLFKCICIYLF